MSKEKTEKKIDQKINETWKNLKIIFNESKKDDLEKYLLDEIIIELRYMRTEITSMIDNLL